ncbi:unnamed protein product [Closterium sp. NIES-65]|nr:unnamed protein product [Closterium sp. NIES-65]
MLSPSVSPALFLLAGYEDGRMALWDVRRPDRPLTAARLHSHPGGRHSHRAVQSMAVWSSAEHGMSGGADTDTVFFRLSLSQVTPALSLSQVTPALSLSQVTPAISLSQVTPALSLSQVTPALSLSQVTPALSLSQVRPALSLSQVRPALLASSLHPLQLRKPRSHRPAQHPSLHTSLQRVSATAQLPDVASHYPRTHRAHLFPFPPCLSISHFMRPSVPPVRPVPSCALPCPPGSMEAVKRVRSQQPGTAAIALHPAGGVAATGGWDGSVRLYDCALLHRPRPAAHLTHHSAAVTAVVFTPDGQLCSASRDATIALCRAR